MKRPDIAGDSVMNVLEWYIKRLDQLELALQSIASIKIDEKTDHSQISAMCIAIARIELEANR
jgi:radical SAM superfamily enzyme